MILPQDRAKLATTPETTAAGTVAVVTGASSGVGEAISTALSGVGARVALVARGAARLEAVARRLTAAGGEVLAVACDCSDPVQVDAACARIQAHFGTPVVLVNAAGTCGELSLIAQSNVHAWWQTLQVNLLAPYLMSRAVLPGMLRSRFGRIINVGSAASLHPPGALTSSYAVSKCALDRLTRQLAVEIQGSGVTVNVIHPGEVKTEMWADIQSQAERGGEAAAGLRAWAALVERTGGDPPQKAGELVLRIIADASLHGRFLWIEDGVQAPLPSWEAPSAGAGAGAGASDGSDHPVLQHLRPQRNERQQRQGQP
jgi:NAD(P)-dependent dehydrogenase (short-subunit alcohol dehydrogenase family)